MRKVKKDMEDLSSREMALLAAEIGFAKKGTDVVVLDVSTLSGFTDYFVIMSGRSTRHVQGLAQAVDDELGLKRLKTTTSEGLQEGIWVLLDYNDVVVHIFYHDTRAFYDLEGLWHDAPRVDVAGLDAGDDL